MSNLRNECAKACALLGLVAFGVSCDADSPQTNAGTETHWLMECDADAQCDVGSCLCGLCTFTCEIEADCRQAPRPAQCAFPSETAQASRCSSNIEGICLAAEGSSNQGSGGTAESSSSAGPTGADAGAAGSSGSAATAGDTGGPSGTGGTPSSGAAAGSGSSGSLGGTSSSGGSNAAGGSESTGGIGGSGSTGGIGGSGGASGSGGGGGVGIAGSSGSSDGGVGTVTEPPASQVVLFELNYTNFAMGTRSEGRYITRDGSLYLYDTGLDPNMSSSDLGSLLQRRETMTLDEITAKYGASPELEATVPLDELYAMHSLLQQAQAGALLMSGSCSDFGEAELVGWLYDESTSSYLPVVVHVSGDTAVENDSPAAAEITAWFSALAGGGEDMCGPAQPAACFEEATCTDEPPECPNRYPGVVGGCWSGDCVDPTGCSDVRTCDDCGTASCITAEDGSMRCSNVSCPYETCPTAFSCSGTTEEVTCGCAASRICAGGSAWCQGSAAEGFSCVAP